VIWLAALLALPLPVPAGGAPQVPVVVRQRMTPVHVGVWYRGLPSGVPREADLEGIRTLGFTAVTWPLQHVSGAEQLQRMAARLGLAVIIRPESVPLTFEHAVRGDTRVDLWVNRTPRAEWPSLVWRAIAYGARTVSFDAGLSEGTGLWDVDGTPEWVPVAAALARQVTSNAGLVGSLGRALPVAIDPPVDDLNLSLLENVRSWVIVVTNRNTAEGGTIDTYATFPEGVPAAEWLSLFDGAMMSMLYRPAGSRWHVRLGPGEAKVFVIDKRDQR